MKQLRLWGAGLATALLTLALRATASASNLSGGNGGQVAFVAPLKNLANALELVGASVVIISIVVIVAQYLMHREDWGGLFRNLVFAIIGGAVVLAAGAFFQQVGLSTQGALI